MAAEEEGVKLFTFKVIHGMVEFRSAVLLFSVCSHCFLFQFSLSCIAFWSIFMMAA